MHTVTVERMFAAQHFLTVPNCGEENELHSHCFTTRVEARGEELNENGYLIDIVGFEDAVEEVVNGFRDSVLNDRDDVQGNPSVERLARAFADSVAEGLDAPCVEELNVRIREDDRAWVSYRRDV